MDLRDELQTNLGSGFTIERELGGGGMSRVFVARDVALGRDVVVKVLPPEMSAEVSAERFRREIQVGAQLQHPHIVPLLSAGASGSLLFYSMPFVSGESLRERMSHAPALSCNESVHIWRELLDALSYAHSRGIVHRDIKPENILLSNKHALVTDFGIARAIQAATGEARMTSTGLALGTPAYMSPEQAAGDRDVDARADIYSAGLVMYEMLAGHPTFAGTSVRQMVTAQLTQEPPPLMARDASTPKSLIALVMRCLAKDPSARPQTADETLETLDSFITPTRTAAGAKPKGARRVTVAAAATVLMVAALTAGAWSAHAGHLPFAMPAKPPNDTLRLAVVIAGTKFDPSDANLGASFRDAVLAELGAEPWLRVTSPTTMAVVFQLAGYDSTLMVRDTVIAIAKRGRANAYIDLTVSRAGSGFLFTAEAKGALHDNSVGVWSAANNATADIPGAMRRVAIELSRAIVRSRRALPATPFIGLTGDMASVAMPTVIEAWSEFNDRKYTDALAKAREATRLDSAFYPAWMILYISAGSAGPISEQIAAVSAAYGLRDRIRSPYDRVMLDAEYFHTLGRDEEALAAFDTGARMMRNNFPPVPPRAGLYIVLRRADVAARLSRAAIDTTYSSLSIMNSRLVNALLSLGKVAEARAEYRRMLAHRDSNEVNAQAARYFIATATRDWPALKVLANDEMAQRGSDARDRGLRYASSVAAVQGQLAQYDSLVRARANARAVSGSPSRAPVPDLASVQLRAMLGDVAGARGMMDRHMAATPWTSREPVDRGYAATLTTLARVGDTTRGIAIAADWTAHMPTAYKLRDSLDVLVARSDLALARGNARDALRLLRLGDLKGCMSCNYPRYARIFDALHMTDSAEKYYEKFATATSPGSPMSDAYELAQTYRRLGEIYEERRDWSHASERYQDFVNLWQHADASLQPVVNDVRTRIERLRAKKG